MTERRNSQLPIGYWLKRADELLTRNIDEAQRANGLTRLEWQALNVIRDGKPREALAPFADAAAVDEVLDGLAERGWIRGRELTPAGVELFDRALATQKAVRERAVSGISEAEYATTVAVLQRLVENLERD